MYLPRLILVAVTCLTAHVLAEDVTVRYILYFEDRATARTKLGTVPREQVDPIAQNMGAWSKNMYIANWDARDGVLRVTNYKKQVLSADSKATFAEMVDIIAKNVGSAGHDGGKPSLPHDGSEHGDSPPGSPPHDGHPGSPSRGSPPRGDAPPCEGPGCGDIPPVHGPPSRSGSPPKGHPPSVPPTDGGGLPPSDGPGMDGGGGDEPPHHFPPSRGGSPGRRPSPPRNGRPGSGSPPRNGRGGSGSPPRNGRPSHPIHGSPPRNRPSPPRGRPSPPRNGGRNGSPTRGRSPPRV